MRIDIDPYFEPRFILNLKHFWRAQDKLRLMEWQEELMLNRNKIEQLNRG